MQQQLQSFKACQRELRRIRLIMRSIEIAKLNLVVITIQSVFRSWTFRSKLMDRRGQSAVLASIKTQAFVRASQFQKELSHRKVVVEKAKQDERNIRLPASVTIQALT